MSRGIPLTFEQVSKAAEVYRSTMNYAEAAKAIGADPSTVRKALIRRGGPDRSFLHAHATDLGITRARKGIAKSLQLAERLLENETADGAGMDPRDIAAIMNAQSRSSEVLLSMADREQKRRQSALTRQKTRAEIEVLKKKAAGELPETTVLISGEDLAYDELVRAKFGHIPVRYKHELPSEITNAADQGVQGLPAGKTGK